LDSEWADKWIWQEVCKTCRTSVNHGKVKHCTGTVSFRNGVKMQIALVVGSTILTIKNDAIRGRELLIVRTTDIDNNYQLLLTNLVLCEL
jgi:ribulose-5-phosphate 4-epimerase/fuculose-1-phosphate aldolase